MAQSLGGTRPLTPEEVASLLRATGDSVRSELTGMADDVASWHPKPGEWCVNECVGHIIETEARGFAGRIQRILEVPGRIERSWDQAQVQRDRNDDVRPMAEILESFSDMRAESIKMIEGLMNTDLDKACVHEEVGELRVEDLLHEWVYHDANHHRQLLAVLQAYVWPALGNGRLSYTS